MNFLTYKNLIDQLTHSIKSKNLADIRQDIYVKIWEYLLLHPNISTEQCKKEITKLTLSLANERYNFYKKQYGDNN